MRYPYVVAGLIAISCGAAWLWIDGGGLLIANLLLWPVVLLAATILLLRRPAVTRNRRSVPRRRTAQPLPGQARLPGRARGRRIS